MNIEIKLNESIKDSMKNKDNLRLDSLRSIKAAILLERTKSSHNSILEEKEIIKILQRLLNQRKDSAKIYLEQDREDLAKIEISQSKIISEFLPDQLSELELTEIINNSISELNASSMKDMGKIMGALKSKHSDSLDFSKVSVILRGLLK